MDDGKWFSSADIQGEYDIATKPGSTQIRSALEMKDNIMQMLVAGGVPFGIFNPSFPKQAAMVLTREMGLPLEMDGYSIHARKQREEIENLKDATGVEGQYGLPLGSLSSTQIPVEETDNDQAHIDMINYYLNTDVGRQEPPEVKKAIIDHMHMHQQAMMFKQQQQMMMAMGGNPMMQAQAQQQVSHAGGKPMNIPPHQQGQPGHGAPPHQQGEEKARAIGA